MSVDSKPMRVVPSGQIYRQMFDAQLQLNRSLSRYDSESRIQRLKSRELTQSQSLPLIRLEKEDTQHGLLTSRQKTWVSGFPNDPYVENPVLCKQYNEFLSQKKQESESSELGRDVRGLPDIVVPKKTGSDIVDRIAQSRRQRHEAAVEDMHQELSVISTEMEPQIEALASNLLKKILADDVEVEAILSRIKSDEDLLEYKLDDLYTLWDEVQAHTPSRQAWIDQMDEDMKQVEAKRMSKIRDVFINYGEKFHKIAHLMAPDLQRFLDKESQMINQTMLSNRRSYADLYVRLISADVEREKTQRTMWRRRVEDWKLLNTKLAVASFKDFMKTDAIVNPEGVENVRQTLLSDQEIINSQRLELINTLCDMKPPNSTKSAVYKWRQDMKKLTAELDNITQIHMSKVHEEYEKVCQICLDKVEEIKQSLIDSGVCTAHRAGQVVDEYMLPLVGEQQRIFEQNLERMEKLTEEHGAEMEEEITALFKFAQGAAHIWDVHEIGLARQERALQEELEKCRQLHDQSNQEKEANLDIVMDRMRQDATEIALKDSLLKALTMLEKIRETYEEFHKQQTSIVQTYPDMVQTELDSYDENVCKFFSLNRKPVRPTEMEEGLSVSEQTESTNSERGEKKEEKKGKEEEEKESEVKELEKEEEDKRKEEEDIEKEEEDKRKEEEDMKKEEEAKEKEEEVVEKEEEGDKKTEEDEKEKTEEEKEREEEEKEGEEEQEGIESEPSEKTHTPTKQQTEEVSPPYDSASEILEIVNSTKGTEYFVLRNSGSTTERTEEGEAKEAEEGQANEEDAAFLTEVAGQSEEEQDSGQGALPDFLFSVHIPSNTITEVKKAIRLNFIDHLDDWSEQALERSDSVVVAKCEELNSELDLRLHLHQPRPRRAELDVHNVRAAELVMHAERVTRHCNGMEQSLTELGHRFKVMTHEHNKLARKFQHDIEALEAIFVNATKSARLVKLQSQVTVELEKFMSVIRTSLRQFRQHLDETLQMLRESNARFIKSFKLFSDGGNFCPEEIEDYRKKLEKMSSMIDSSEGTIMSDLEGMESKRLEAATKIAVEFEDRFKGHMSDLVFMERVARWLTNTQVKIKSEVANSNSQAQKLAALLNDLERRIDACDKPNLDKEQITASQLNETLFPIFEAFVSRSEYLNCLKTNTGAGAMGAGPQATDSASNDIVKKDKKGANPKNKSGNSLVTDSTKVGFTADTVSVSKGGKQGAEDPSVGVIKSILNKPPSASKEKTQRAKMRFGSEAELDGDPNFNLSAPADSAREKTKSAMSQASSKGSEASKSTKKGQPSGGEIAPRRTQSGRRISKPAKFDKKYMLFGEKPEEGEPDALDGKHFMAVITRTLRDALDGLLTTAEVFYRQKGTRPVTRPQALQETFEQCAEIITQKMHSYCHQADNYHNQCLQEFRAQLTRLEQLSAMVPRLVIEDMLRDEIERSSQAQKLLTDRFQATLDQLAERQESNRNELRPTLGHPHKETELQTLCTTESERHNDYLEAVEKQTVARQQCALDEAKAFLDRLVRTAELQLLQYDGLLVIDDVEKGRVEPTRYPTSELIRRKNAGEPLEDEEDKDALPRGKANWIGVPSNEFVVKGLLNKHSETSLIEDVPDNLFMLEESQSLRTGPNSIQGVSNNEFVLEEHSNWSNNEFDEEETPRVPSNQFVVDGRPSKLQVTPTVPTKKTTLAHTAAVKARDKAYQDYKEQFERTLQQIESEKERQLLAEQRWEKSWETSVDKVKSLYQKEG